LTRSERYRLLPTLKLRKFGTIPVLTVSASTMRTVLGPSVALMLLLCALAPISYAQQSTTAKKPPKASAQASDHIRLSSPVLKGWREIAVGSPVYALDDAAGTKDWLQRARIQRVTAQTGIWHIWIERGYTVFGICPYLSEKDPEPPVYQGMVVKVNGDLSVADLIAAIRNRSSSVRIDEYDVFGKHGLSVQRYSRPNPPHGGE